MCPWGYFQWKLTFESVDWVKQVALFNVGSVQSVQLLCHVWLFVTPWTAACQAFLSFTNSRSCSNLCPLSRWCHPTISSSVIPFFSIWAGLVKSVEGLSRTKRCGRENSLSLPYCLQAGTLISCLRTQTWAGTQTISSPGCPTCRWQILRLLSLHYHVNEFFIINLSGLPWWSSG